HAEGAPAIKYSNGDSVFYNHGKLHNYCGPAITYNRYYNNRKFTYKAWYVNGKIHRYDGPAIEHYSPLYTFCNCHEDSDITTKYTCDIASEGANGDKEWYKNGNRHREGGPAVEWANGDKEWYKNGNRHREGGPAVERANGDKEWYK